MKNSQKDKQALFLNYLQLNFPLQYEQIVDAISKPPALAFRLTSKATENTLTALSAQGFTIQKGPIENSYIIELAPATLALSQTTEFETGEIYIQNLSSMLPATILDPKPKDTILDMCAAPGSKTTQLAELTNGLAQIVAVENNKERFYRLKQNITKYNFENIQLLNEDATLIAKKYLQYINYFDKILVDAPCSNEGQINLLDQKSIKHWNPKLAKKISKLQKRLVASAIQLLKVGGILVYSTCTSSPEENEKVIEWVLEKFPNMTITDQKRVFPDGKFTAFYYAKLEKISD